VLAKVLLNLKSAIEETHTVVQALTLPAVTMHEFHLTELLQNLISNAIKYRSSDPPRIEIGARPEDDFWTFWVADNGIGIAPEHASQVFGLFKRLHSSDSYEGTGVGLAICERVVERYGGAIWVEPRSPKGSTFYFKVRRQSTEPKKDGAQALAEPALKGATP
jgi:light-regulated signal transduction histidine kinase (bacteriophytochrome)